MSRCSREWSLQDALSDPLIQAVMEADGVDPDELAADLSEIALTLRRRGAAPAARCDMALYA